VTIGQPFSGNALRAVDGEGRTRLPPFVLRVLERRGAGARLLLGAHPSGLCLSGYDEGHTAVLFAELERLQLRDEAVGVAETAHHARAHTMFGAVEEARFDAGGRFVLPAMMRRRGRIAGLALYVGTGGSFEIWDPHLAREAGGDVLRELAEYLLHDAGHLEREDAG